MSSITNVNNERSIKAYKFAEQGKGLGDKSGNYKSYVKKMPMLIKTNGLAPALAFALSKAKGKVDSGTQDPWGLLHNQIGTWLSEQKQGFNVSNDKGLAASLSNNLSSDQYRHATTEVMEFLNWLRRYAEGLIDKEETNGE